MLPYFVIGGVVLLICWLLYRFFKWHKKNNKEAEQGNDSSLSPEEKQFFDDYYRGMR